MGAGEAKRGDIPREKVTKGGGEEFSSFITLHTLDGNVELSKYVSVKAVNNVNGVGLVAQRESPNIMRATVKYNQIVHEARYTSYRQSPNI